MNNKFVQSYKIIPPFRVVVTQGQPTEFANAQNLKELIEHGSDHKNITLVMSNTKERKRKRQLTCRSRLIEALRKESQRPVLNTTKIDSLRKEIEGIDKNLR